MLRRFWKVGLALAVVATLYGPLTASAATSRARLGSRLVHRFFNELVRSDVAGLRSFLSPAFQIQRADGSRENKAHYLAHLPHVLSYRLRKLVVTSAPGVVVVTYVASTTELVGGKPEQSAFAPRISAFVRGGGRWRLVSHANHNPPRP